MQAESFRQFYLVERAVLLAAQELYNSLLERPVVLTFAFVGHLTG